MHQTLEAHYEAKIKKSKVLQRHVNSVSVRSASDSGTPKEAIGEILISLLPIFASWLTKELPCSKDDDTTTDPTPDSTPVTQLAWKNAGTIKEQADEGWDEESGTFRQETIRQMSIQIRRGKRRTNERVSGKEGKAMALRLLEEARASSREDVQTAILDLAV